MQMKKNLFDKIKWNNLLGIIVCITFEQGDRKFLTYRKLMIKSCF